MEGERIGKGDGGVELDICRRCPPRDASEANGECCGLSVLLSASVLTDAGAVVMACEARRTQHHALVSTNQIAALLRHVTSVPSRRALVVVYL